jgi:hypothetical protein
MLDDFCASVIAESLSHISKFCLDDFEYSFWILENILTLFDECLYSEELILDLLSLEARKLLESHFENGCRLSI